MRSYSVETRGQGVLILGGPRDLTTKLIEEFLLAGYRAISPDNLQDIEELYSSHDLDYCLCFDQAISPTISERISHLVATGETRLVLVSHHSTTPVSPFPQAPIFKNLIYSDYLGAGECRSSLLQAWRATIASSHTLSLAGDGLAEISLLQLDDLAHLVVLATINPSTTVGQQYWLGNPEPISHLSLAYLVRSNLPYKAQITFVQNDDQPSLAWDNTSYLATTQLLAFTPHRQIEPSLKALFSSPSQLEVKPEPEKPSLAPPTPKPQPVSPPPPPAPPLKKLTPLKQPKVYFVPLEERKPKVTLRLPKFTFKRLGAQKTRRTFHLNSVVGKGFLIAFALYFGTLAFFATVSGLMLQKSYRAIQNNELPQVTSLNKFSLTYLRANALAISSLPILSGRQFFQDLNTLLDAYHQSLAVFELAGSLNSSTQELIHYTFGSGTADVAQLISQSRLEIEELYQKLSLLDGVLPPTAPAIIPEVHHDKYLKIKSQLASLKRSITTAKALLATAPDFIGLGGRRKYGVLFQNNMELRATGGFIGSFAILTFENGKLYDMPIFDVYDADGQLKGHVEPPTPIKTFLGEANWYLRDSNFDPDFPTSARRAEWFIKKSLNQDVDGMIAVNVDTLIGLLKATGPLLISDYNETITDGNLYERSQYHAEVNFFPGSTQKKEFLSTVANSLFAKLPSLGAGEGIKMVEALTTSIAEKNTLVSLSNASADHVFATLGWNGAVTDLPCPVPDNCAKDYAMVVDSNFGVNKANYFLRRSLDMVITFDKNLVVGHTLKINYQNTSTSTAWPSGAYKNYSRIYLPLGATLNHLKIGDRLIESKDYTLTMEHNKLVLGFLANIPVNSTVTVEVDYSTPQLPQTPDLTYTWYWQKQPGTSSRDQLTVYLNHPLYLKPLIISPSAQLETQQLKFNFTNDTDHRVTVKFQK